MAKQYKEFTKQSAREIRQEIDKVLKQLEQFGLDANIGTITIDGDELRTKLSIKPKSVTHARTASVINPGSTSLKTLNDRDLFDALDGGRVELSDGKTYRMVGFKPQNRKYPFIIEGPQGGRYKVSRSHLKIK